MLVLASGMFSLLHADCANFTDFTTQLEVGAQRRKGTQRNIMLRGWCTACYANRCEGREDLRMGKNGRVYRKTKHNNKDIICLYVSKKLSTFVATRKGYMSKEMTRFDGLYNEVREIIAKAKQN